MSQFLQHLRQESRAHPARAIRWLDLATGAFPGRQGIAVLRASTALRAGQPALAVVRFLAAIQRHPGHKQLSQGLARAFEQSGRPEFALEQWLALASEDPRQASALGHTWILLEKLGLSALPSSQSLAKAEFLHLRSHNRRALRRASRSLGEARQILGAAWIEGTQLKGWAYDSVFPTHAPEIKIYSNGRLSSTLIPSERFPLGRAFSHSLPDIPGREGLMIDVFAADHTRLSGAPMRYGPPPPPPKCRAPTGSPSRRSGGVNLVIPVYRGHELAARCIDSVLTSKAANSTAFRLVLVNDCSPEPEIKPWLRAVAHNAQGVYLQTQRNLGFIGAINFAMDVCRGRDMVWLNSDTIVYGDWLDRLSAAAWSDPDVATATPLSNNAQLFSYPQPMTANPFPNAQKTALLHRLAALANDRAYEEVPTAIGFCMYLKAEALSAAGRLDDRAYLLGYAEEIDYCFRLASAGWRHLCATDVFVAHKGGASFQLDKARLSKDNDLVIQERYPAQRLEAGVFQRRDPLFKARARLERLWLADNLDWDGLFLLSERAANRYFTYDLLLRRQRSGCRDLQVRHIESRHGPSVRLEGALETPPHNLSFQLPEQRAELVQTLLSLNLSETTTILHDRACPALFLDILASKSEAFDLICLDDSLEDNAYLRAPLPVNHVRRAHSRYRIARWLRSSGHRGTAPNQTQLLPLDTRIDNLWAPIEAPEGPAWVAVWSQEISASEQQRLIELVRIRQTTIRWLLVGQVYDEAAFLSTGQCECLSNPSPSTLLQHLAWIGCRCILHPSRSPGPDPSAFLASRRLMIPYVGIRAADGLAYLTEPMTYGVAINASSEALLSVIAEALTEGTEQGP